jgi:hypothetical protein
MTQIVLQPSADATARAHYADTISRPVVLSHVYSLLSTPMIEHLEGLFPSGSAAMWGVTPGKNGVNIRKWEKVELGALVLFAANGRIFGSGIVAAKFHNRELAEHLWNFDANGMTWEYMYALDEVRDLNIPYLDFNNSVGYAPNYVIQGFNVLDETKSKAFLDAFDLRASRIEWPPDPEEVAIAIREFEELDRRFQAVQRLEQGALREHLLKGRASGECLLCGRTFHAHFLVAGHIKKRAACTDDEKRDLQNIGMLNCKFGCDELYERGYISVDGQGIVVKSSRLVSPVEREYMNSTVLSRIVVSPNSERYFTWHFQHQFKS